MWSPDGSRVFFTAETAAENDLSTIADLTDLAGDMTLGAPPEFQTRAQGLPGLQETYGLTFASFQPLTGTALVQALVNGQIQAANIFTTDPAISVNDLAGVAAQRRHSQWEARISRVDRAVES